MTAENLPDFDSADQLAGEFVLGTLSAERRAEVERRMPHDAALMAAVRHWQERLLPLTALAEPVQPSAGLWDRIDVSLNRQATAHAAALPYVAPNADGAGVVPSGRRTGNRPSTAQTRPQGGNWWDSLKLWRGLAGSGFAAAAILAAVLVSRIGAAPGTPQYLVVLVAPQDKAPGWVVQSSSDRQLSLIPVSKTVVPTEKSLQFWTKGESWAGPVSLGLVKPGQTVRIPLDKLPPLQSNQLFELTLEPANGSPTNRPTGPIQFIGRAVKVM